MKNKLYLMLGLVCVFGFFSIQDTYAAIYKYMDSDGQINFTDDLQSVPVSCRATAKIVSGESDEKNVTSSSNNDQAKAAAGTVAPEGAPQTASVVVSEKQKPVESGEGTDSFGKRAIYSAVILVSAVFAFIILGILDTDHKKIVAIVRVVLMWGMTIYLIYAHAGDVVHLFSSTGNKIEAVHRKSEEKGKKAARAAKSLDSLLDQAEQAAADTPDSEGEEKNRK